MIGRPVAELIPVTNLEAETVVVIDRQLLALANRVATAFAMALPARVDGDRLQLEIDDTADPDADVDDEDAPPPAWALALTANHPAVSTYVGAMLALQHWEALPDADAIIDPHREPVVATLQQVMAWYEIALPFAHVASGHHTNEGTERLPWIEGDFTADRYAWDEDQDEEATVRAIYAVINRGTQAGLEPGHVLRAYQTGQTIRDSHRGLVGQKVRLPDEPAGTMMVFRTAERLSYALVMEVTTPLALLDIVRTP